MVRGIVQKQVWVKVKDVQVYRKLNIELSLGQYLSF